MLKLIIYKDKITINKWEDNSNSWGEFDILKLEGSITKYFNKVVEIKQDVTVQDFMNHLERYESIIDYCFSDYLKQVPFRKFFDDMNKDGEGSDFCDVELCWEGEIISGNLAMIGYLRAWLKDEKIQELAEESKISPEQFEVPHEVSLMPIHMWKDCNMFLNEHIIINDLGEVNVLKRDVLFSGFYRWTLFDVISQFFQEISMSGSPDERDKIFSDIKDKKYNVKEIAKSKDQYDFWLVFLEQELIDLNKSMDLALENEEYEKAAKLKFDIETSEKELLELKEEIKKNGTSREDISN